MMANIDTITNTILIFKITVTEKKKKKLWNSTN